jgi:hypothetical protein
MQALRVPKHLAGAVFVAASALVGIGVWVFFRGQGKNGFDTMPLFWLFAVLSAPPLSLACVVTMWRQRASAWLAAFATFLLLPQAVVWYFAVMGVLHYSGFAG